MDAAKRQRYLRALGVEVWVPRTTAPSDRSVAGMALSYGAADSVGAGHARDRVLEPAQDLLEAAPVTERKTAAVAVAPQLIQIAEPNPGLAPITVPTDWAGLRAMVKDCTRCKLCSTRTKTVFGVGPESAPLMVIGEGPGADEDAQGEPFVGRAGKLLDEMLAAIGRSRRDNVFIANVVKCRPPGNRDPESDEVEACRPYLDQQIRLIKPKLIVGLGRIAAQRLLATDAPLSRLRGPLQQYGPEKIPLFITYHPAYLLRSPREKAKSWDDLKKVWRYLRDHE